MLSELGESENFRTNINKYSEELCTTLLRSRSRRAGARPGLLEETYGVEYAYLSCRRVLNEPGLSYHKPRRSATEADDSDRKQLLDDLKKASWDGRHGSLHRSNKKSVHFKPRTAWFPRGTRPSVDLSGQRDWTCVGRDRRRR